MVAKQNSLVVERKGELEIQKDRGKVGIFWTLESTAVPKCCCYTSPKILCGYIGKEPLELLVIAPEERQGLQ